jgi:hypothetical protein
MKHLATICILNCAAIVSATAGLGAQQPAAPGQAAPASSAPQSVAPIDLRPKFAPGQTLRYQMELQTTTTGSSGGVVEDPQGPSKLVVTWDATIRVDVLPPGVMPPNALAAATPPAAQSPAASVALRLRMTYEKSAATVQSDGYDPAAESVQPQYQHLVGRVVEFALDAHGKVTDVSGVEDVFESPQAARDAQAWVEQLSSGLGAPGSSVAPGQTWSADEPATAIPLPGMTWHTDSTYLRNEPCRQPSPAVPGASAAASLPAVAGPVIAATPQAAASPPAVAGVPTAGVASAASGESCAVILTHVSLVPPKSAQKSGSAAAPKPAPGPIEGMHTVGNWTGSGESLIYVSLRTGWIVSVSQSGDERMDVTIINEHLDSMRYAGAVHSHVSLLLLPQ